MASVSQDMGDDRGHDMDGDTGDDVGAGSLWVPDGCAVCVRFEGER